MEKTTDNEIIKTLECCSNSPKRCKECPLLIPGGCGQINKEELYLDLINRQKAEIERLRKANGLLKYLKEAVHRIEIDGKTEVVEYASDEAFQNAITKKINLMCNVQTAKSEAIKEFWEILKNHKTTMDKRIISVESGDNLVKEMTEGNGNVKD